MLLDDNEIKAGKAGAIAVILNAISAHLDSRCVTEWGCRALRGITFNGT